MGEVDFEFDSSFYKIKKNDNVIPFTRKETTSRQRKGASCMKDNVIPFRSRQQRERDEKQRICIGQAKEMLKRRQREQTQNEK